MPDEHPEADGPSADESRAARQPAGEPSAAPADGDAPPTPAADSPARATEADGDPAATPPTPSGADDPAATAAFDVGQEESADPAATAALGVDDDSSTAPLAVGPEPEGVSGDEAAATATLAAPGVAGAWAARAEVPPRGAVRSAGPATGWQRPPGDVDDAAVWDAGTDDGRRWWWPIVAGIVAMVLLAVLGYGVWLIVHAMGRGQPATQGSTGPLPSASTSASAQASASPSRRESSAPAQVTVPSLAGKALAAARSQLRALGLRYRVRYETTADVPAGQVITTSPAAGSTVDRGSTVTIVVASAPVATSTPTASSAPTATPTASSAPTATPH